MVGAFFLAPLPLTGTPGEKVSLIGSDCVFEAAPPPPPSQGQSNVIFPLFLGPDWSRAAPQKSASEGMVEAK